MSLETASESIAPASWFFREFVLLNYREFVADQLCRRRAYNTAVSIAHMPDHIVIRGGGLRGQVKNARDMFRKQSAAFGQVEAMCNAFKHVHATGGGLQNSIIMTSTGMSTVDTDTILFVSPIDGEDYEFRPAERLLVCDFNDNGRTRTLWIAWTLYSALSFFARKINYEDLLLNSDQPSQVNLVRRPVTANRQDRKS